jgi:hypothetical protein
MQSLQNALNDPQIKWNQVEVFRLAREEAAEELLAEPASALHHRFTPMRAISFEPIKPGSKTWWPTAKSFAFHSAAYVEALSAFDLLVRTSRTVEGLPPLTVALTGLVEHANKLGFLGWQVNWHQNVQWALRGSRFGLSGYSLIERYENLPHTMTLSERLELIGGPVFYKQARTAKTIKPIEPVYLSEQAEISFGSIFLSLASIGRRYSSDWIDCVQGKSFRLLSD